MNPLFVWLIMVPAIVLLALVGAWLLHGATPKKGSSWLTCQQEVWLGVLSLAVALVQSASLIMILRLLPTDYLPFAFLVG